MLMGRHREAAQQQLHHHSTQMGTNGPDDAAAVSGAWHTASGQRGAARTCRATASTEQTTRLEGDRQPARATHNSNEAARSWARTNRTTRPPSAALRAERAGREAPDVPAGPLRAASRRTRLPGATASRPDTHNYTVRRDVRRGADGQPTAGQDDIFRVKGATQPGRSRLVADGAGSQCDGNAWTRGWWHRPTPTFDEHLASTVVGSVEGESAISRHKKSTATS